MYEYDDIEGGLIDDEEMEALFGLPDEWVTKYEGRWYGKYRALVRDVDDSSKWVRIRVECPDIYGAGNISPWAEPIGAKGSDSGVGNVWLPEVGAVVWVEFEHGDPDFPLWIDGPWFDGTEGIPPHAKGESDGTDTASPKGTGIGFIPASTANPSYPHWRGLKTPGGHMVEYDDTPGHKRVQLYHEKGHHLEFLQDGSIHLAALKKIKIAAIGDELRLATMDTTCTIKGNEIGMSLVGGLYGPKGWLGQKSTATEPVVCGNLLIAYLTALNGVLLSVFNIINTFWGVMQADPTFAIHVQTLQGLATALSGLGTIINTTLPNLMVLYFTPGLPTCFMSDVWYTTKSGASPEA